MTTSIDLVPYLESYGLRIARVSGDEITMWCPAHLSRLGRPDKRPSFDFNQSKLVGNCPSCGWNVPSLSFLIEYVTGEPPIDDVLIEAQKMAVGEAVRRLAQSKRDVLLKDSPRYLEWTLAHKFTPVPRQLLEFRRLTRTAADHFGIRWDPSQRCWVLPIRTPQGSILGWQQRQKGGFWNYPKGVQKSGTLFGFHQVESERVVLVESPLDVARLWQAGVPPVSSYGSGVSNRQVELLARNFSVVVVALDNDPPGNEAADRVMYQLRKRIAALRWDYSGTNAKDPGDYVSDEELYKAWKKTSRLGF
jgi:Toprim domain-containing protein